MHIFRWYEGAHIVTVVVDEKYRRKGIGSLLVKEIENYARSKGAKVLPPDTTPDNIDALMFYLKNGFKISDYRERLEENGKPTIYLMKKCPPPA
jgi:GNAT superfamily N-acetyltransferase